MQKLGGSMPPAPDNSQMPGMPAPTEQPDKQPPFDENGKALGSIEA